MLTLAAVVVGVHLASVHLNPELSGERPYNNFNPGLYVRTDQGWQVGSYWNSHRVPTFYAGKAWTFAQSESWDFGILVAGATGYPAGDVVPMLAASVRYKNMRLSATPRIGNKASALIHLSLEF